MVTMLILITRFEDTGYSATTAITNMQIRVGSSQTTQVLKLQKESTHKPLKNCSHRLRKVLESSKANEVRGWSEEG